jgi:antitoxin component YwqK of YwqJK toxin-antitoxin module
MKFLAKCISNIWAVAVFSSLNAQTDTIKSVNENIIVSTIYKREKNAIYLTEFYIDLQKRSLCNNPDALLCPEMMIGEKITKIYYKQKRVWKTYYDNGKLCEEGKFKRLNARFFDELRNFFTNSFKKKDYGKK